MQAIKEKLHDMSEVRQAKAEAKEEEKVEKRVAHEMRMAKEAQATVKLHVNKASEMAAEYDRKQHLPEHEQSDPIETGRITGGPPAHTHLL
ncbi:hypothetical protein M569_09182 [Genlisea aurea]|uniref:Uncharacterized protein n=1 Tax=Genlisea aurea TaxID=192259 RepID=S8DR70_9LAMI|nr:hypothetical protein M569_09182 [Genlisea aurea]